MDKISNKKIVKCYESQPQNHLNNVTANELAEEILPILNDFFCGSFSVNMGKIIMKLNNGQTFCLCISEGCNV